MNKLKELKTVTETFNIFNDGRQHNPAPQNFALNAVQRVLTASKTLELINLGEAVGFWGHNVRELTNRIRPKETEIITIDGKPVIMNMVPAIKTREAGCDNQGNVTHTETFLDTEGGRASLACYEAGVGGFSWAMLGGNNPKALEAREFAGFDYVKQPNFIPLKRQAMLLSSMGDNGHELLLSNMQQQGFDDEVAGSMINGWQNTDGHEADLNELVAASLIEEKERREMLFSSVIEKMPFFLDDEQKQALLSMNTEHDAEVVSLLFSSIQNTDMSQLPHSMPKQSIYIPSEGAAPDMPTCKPTKLGFA